MKNKVCQLLLHGENISQTVLILPPPNTLTIVQKTESRELNQVDRLNQARKIKNDEFYTRYEDVVKELSMYPPSIWKDKVLFCNCDDVVGDDEKNTSPFALYFLKNFNELGLKKLICTHYTSANGYVFTTDGVRKIKDYPQDYDGSFDHPLSLKILKEEADIVCTNPPFSRARDYWKILVESGKKFIIISNITNPITPAFIPYFKHGKVWAGFTRIDYFVSPDQQLIEAAGHWYTNIPLIERPKHKHLKIMPLKAIPEKYKQYDDAKVLLMGHGYIPSDYPQPFAVSARPILNGLLEKGYRIIEQNESYMAHINGKKCFRRVLVQKSG